MRIDNAIGFAYVGPGNGSTPAEAFSVVNPANASELSPIRPGGTMLLRNTATGKFCRLAPLSVAQPLRWRARAPASCATQGVVCDRDLASEAAVLTYTGYGLSYQGTPLVQSLTTRTLILSSDPACTVPGGDRLTLASRPLLLGRCLVPSGSAVWPVHDACVGMLRPKFCFRCALLPACCCWHHVRPMQPAHTAATAAVSWSL